MRQEMAEEQGHLFALDVVLEKLAIQGAMEAPGTDGDTRDGGASVVAIAVSEDRRLAHGAPCLAHAEYS